MTQSDLVLPVLSAGRHRNARKGACFMEFASYLAGERWSDHPQCTHPLLAALARDVNDLVSDTARTKLVAHVHRVVGLTSDHPDIAARIAVVTALGAIDVVSMERQHALAVGLLRLAEDHPALRGMIDAGLATVPASRRWATDVLARATARGERAAERAEYRMVHTAAVGVALACVDDTDDRLIALLVAAINEVEARVVPAAAEHPRIERTTPAHERMRELHTV